MTRKYTQNHSDLFIKNIMDKFFGNWLDDSVIREDENGNRYIKRVTPGKIPVEVAVSTDCKAAFGGQGYGEVHELLEISKEEYETYGIKWGWGADPWHKMTNKKTNRITKKTTEEMEYVSIEDLITSGVEFGYIQEKDKPYILAEIRRYYHNQQFEDITDVKVIDGIPTVPLNLKGLRGLVRQAIKTRDSQRSKEFNFNYEITSLPNETPRIKKAFEILYKHGYVSIKKNKWFWERKPILLGYVINLLYGPKGIPRDALSRYFDNIKSLSGNITQSTYPVQKQGATEERKDIETLLNRL